MLSAVAYADVDGTLVKFRGLPKSLPIFAFLAIVRATLRTRELPRAGGALCRCCRSSARRLRTRCDRAGVSSNAQRSKRSLDRTRHTFAPTSQCGDQLRVKAVDASPYFAAAVALEDALSAFDAPPDEVFVVRFWPETESDDPHRWRGCVDHVPTNRRRFFVLFDELNAFIDERLRAQRNP